MTKTFLIPANKIRQIIDSNAGCLATDRITIDGSRVGWMYRSDASRPEDSGWRFFAGDESDSYMADTSNHNVYSVNTIANYDPSIVPYLDSPVGSAYERLPDMQDFIRVDDWDSADSA